MTNIAYGNRNHLSVRDDNSWYDTITLGNGRGDYVSDWGFHNTITLGNGAGDTVVTESGNDTITLGNGAGDTVYGNKIGGDIITLGDGRGDSVNFFDSAGIYSPPLIAGNTVTLGDGRGDHVIADYTSGDSITLGNGAGDTVRAGNSSYDSITVGNGNHDVVDVYGTAGSIEDSITVGNGNDTIYAGQNTTIKVGTGHDSFVFEQTAPSTIGNAVITGFNANHDSFTFSNQLATSVTYHDDANGNAVIAVDHYDSITLEGVHAAQLHAADFHFVDDPAAAIAQHLQQIADHHAIL
jgi:serralysin